MSKPTTAQKIGGTGGSPFSFTGENNGASLEKIGMWLGESQVKAVKVWLSDGRSETFGNPDGPYQEYTFKPGECFTSLSLWDNGENTHLGAIKFQTNKGGEFFAKMTKNSLPTEHPMDVGSGFSLGVVGRAGADIDCMGFMFLNAVQSVVLTKVSYPTLYELTATMCMENLLFITYKNYTSTNQKQTVETKKMSKESSWSMNNSFTATFSVEVKAGIPELVKKSLFSSKECEEKFEIKVGEIGSYSQEFTNEGTETLTFPIDVPPKKKVDVKLTIGRAITDMDYLGTVVITCKNGSFLEYKTGGQYKGVTYSDIGMETTESDL